jgi:hypothetical protein
MDAKQLLLVSELCLISSQEVDISPVMPAAPSGTSESISGNNALDVR